jgi:enoyl-CoA hydratase
MASTRDTALLAAAEILAGEGLAALTLERVASVVGVKPASLYHHFASRDQLVDEVLTRGLVAVRAGVEDALRDVPADQSLRRLETAARAHIRALGGHAPFTVAALRNADQVSPELRTSLMPHQDAVRACWTRLFDDAVAAGIFPPHVDVPALRLLVQSAVGAAGGANAVGAGSVSTEALAEQLVDLLRGAAVGPGRAPSSLVEVDLDGPIGRLRLAHPPVNALSAELVAGLDLALEDVARSAARVVLVSSAMAGEFCAGADLTLTRRLDPAGFETYLRHLHDVFERLAHLSIPTIAVVDGPAFGCGLELAVACTFRVATPRATFALPEVTMGLRPGAGTTLRLPRLVGQQVALDLVLSGRTVDATEAHVTGLVDRVEQDAHGAATAWAEQMARWSRDALSAALRSVRAGESAGLAELREAVALFDHPAAAEGIEAHAALVTAGTPRPRRRRR